MSNSFDLSFIFNVNKNSNFKVLGLIADCYVVY